MEPLFHLIVDGDWREIQRVFYKPYFFTEVY